ncbi:hypothetical protein ACN28S_48120 [Cystobacter fuscus]
MRHVLMSTQSSREAWTCALELSRALGERGPAVTLATLGAPLTLAQWAEARDVPGLRVEQSVWRSEDMPDAWDDVAESGAWLLELEAGTCRTWSISTATAMARCPGSASRWWWAMRAPWREHGASRATSRRCRGG